MVHLSHPTSNLEPAGTHASDTLDHSKVVRSFALRGVEVYDVDPAGPVTLETARSLNRVGSIRG
jgi:hypothetical protein